LRRPSSPSTTRTVMSSADMAIRSNRGNVEGHLAQSPGWIRRSTLRPPQRASISRHPRSGFQPNEIPGLNTNLRSAAARLSTVIVGRRYWPAREHAAPALGVTFDAKMIVRCSTRRRTGNDWDHLPPFGQRHPHRKKLPSGRSGTGSPCSVTWPSDRLRPEHQPIGIHREPHSRTNLPSRVRLRCRTEFPSASPAGGQGVLPKAPAIPASAARLVSAAHRKNAVACLRDVGPVFVDRVARAGGGVETECYAPDNKN